MTHATRLKICRRLLLFGPHRAPVNIARIIIVSTWPKCEHGERDGRRNVQQLLNYVNLKYEIVAEYKRHLSLGQLSLPLTNSISMIAAADRYTADQLRQ